MAVEYCWEGLDLSKVEGCKVMVPLHIQPTSREEGAPKRLHFISAAGGTFLIGPAMVGYNIRIGLVARICRSQSSKDDQFRQGRGSIPRFGIILLLFVGLTASILQPVAVSIFQSILRGSWYNLLDGQDQIVVYTQCKCHMVP